MGALQGEKQSIGESVSVAIFQSAPLKIFYHRYSRLGFHHHHHHHRGSILIAARAALRTTV